MQQTEGAKQERSHRMQSRLEMWQPEVRHGQLKRLVWSKLHWLCPTRRHISYKLLWALGKAGNVLKRAGQCWITSKCQRLYAVIKGILSGSWAGDTHWSQTDKNDTDLHLWSAMDNFKILLLTFYLKPKLYFWNNDFNLINGMVTGNINLVKCWVLVGLERSVSQQSLHISH